MRQVQDGQAVVDPQDRHGRQHDVAVRNRVSDPEPVVQPRRHLRCAQRLAPN